ncbi:MAG: choice-of-anchor R domain-containing protein [Verrucomicrobiales bacterium]
MNVQSFSRKFEAGGHLRLRCNGTRPIETGSVPLSILHLLATALAACSALAQDIAIHPIGFTNGFGASTDGTFSVSGTMTPGGPAAMSDGTFAINGDFVSPGLTTPVLEVSTIFDNTGGEENGVMGVTDTAWLAGKCCLGAQAYTLDSVSLLLDSRDSNGLPGPPSAVRLQIYSNDPVSGKPSASTGAIMHLFDLANPLTPPPSGRGLVKWTSSTPFKLEAHTCYWVVLSRESGGYIGQTVSATTPIGPAGTFGRTRSLDAGATWEEAAIFNFKMLIEGTASGPPRAREPIVNGGFENTQTTFAGDAFGIMSLTPGSTSIPGWTTINAELAWVDDVNTFGAATPFGTHSLDLTGYHDGRPYGGIVQILTTLPGEHYRMGFSLGSYEDVFQYRGPVSVEVTVGAVSREFTFTPNGTGNQWGDFYLDFTAESSLTPLSITGTASAGGAYLGLDNVSVTQASASETLQVGSVTITGEELRIQFASVSGIRYALESREDLTSGEWRVVPGSERTATSTSLVLTESVEPRAQPRRFFRVVEVR